MFTKTALAAALLSTGAIATYVPRSTGPRVLSLPLTRREDALRDGLFRRDDEDVQVYNYSTIAYMVELGIGTPAQNVKVAFDTGSSELWVNPQCSAITASQNRAFCATLGRYNPKSSSTAVSQNKTGGIPYLSGTTNFTYYKDNVALTGTSDVVKNFQFGVASRSSEMPTGILGVSFGSGTSNNTLSYPNFIDQLYTQNLTNSRAFSVGIGDVDTNNNGSVIFGGIDTKRFVGGLTTLPILGPQPVDDGELDRYWVQMTSVGITKDGSSKTYSNSKMPIIVDTGSSISLLPTALMNQIYSDFSGATKQSGGYIMVDCSYRQKQGTFDFVFDTLTIKIPFKSFIWEAATSICVIGAISQPSTGVMLLGDTFLRSAYVVFDQDNKQVHMARYGDCGENIQEIPAGNGVIGKFVGECNESAIDTTSAAAPQFGSAPGVWAAFGVALMVQLGMCLL